MCPYEVSFLSTTPSQPVILPILLWPFARSSHMIGQNRGYTKKTIKETFCEYWITYFCHFAWSSSCLNIFFGDTTFLTQGIRDPIPDLGLGLRRFTGDARPQFRAPSAHERAGDPAVPPARSGTAGSDEALAFQRWSKLCGGLREDHPTVVVKNHIPSFIDGLPWIKWGLTIGLLTKIIQDIDYQWEKQWFGVPSFRKLPYVR